MQFKVYRGVFGILALMLLALAIVFFMLPAVLIFIAIVTVVSLVGSVATGLLGPKTKRPTMTQQESNGKTIDIAAEIE